MSITMYIRNGQAFSLEELREELPNCRAIREVEELRAERDALVAERDQLVEALTPSAETKAAYIGEFHVRLPDTDEDGNECVREINVPWTTVKAIMVAILARADCKQAEQMDTASRLKAAGGAETPVEQGRAKENWRKA